jgi:hypothetical protein
VVSTAGAILFGHFGPFFGTALVASVPSLVFDYLAPGSYFNSIVELIVGQIVSATLSGIGISLGMILLLVPGFILATMWAVAIPAAVLEERGVTSSLSRSQELTSGRRWRVFGAYLVAGLIMLVGVGIVEGAAIAIAGVGSTFSLVAIWGFVALSQAFTACVVATLYYYLRREREGVEIDHIAAVFD